MAWHIARLFHSDPQQFPELGQMTGEIVGQPEHSPEKMLAAVRQWKFALKQRFEKEGR